MRQDEDQLSQTEMAHLSSLEAIDYEICKKMRQIYDWQDLGANHTSQREFCNKQIRDAEVRIAVLERQRGEVENEDNPSWSDGGEGANEH